MGHNVHTTWLGGYLVRAGQVQGVVPLVCLQIRVSSHGEKVGHHGNVAPASSDVEGSAAGVRRLVQVHLTGLRQELHVSEGALLHCQVQGSLATAEVLWREGRGGEVMLYQCSPWGWPCLLC